jgi:Ni2+-binding GTPase involved in maturation of urease and hydrogenase
MSVCVLADGGVLYICGVPGTGKTALVMEMLRGLAPQALRAGAQVVAINCLQLPTPQHVFSRPVCCDLTCVMICETDVACVMPYMAAWEQHRPLRFCAMPSDLHAEP